MTGEYFKQKMVSEADLILKSVNFTENQINLVIGKIKYAEDNFLIKEEEMYKNQLAKLISKIDKEMMEMENHIKKYEYIAYAIITGKL